MSVELVPSRLTHVGPIATRMREIDKLECGAFGRSPKDGLRYSLRTSLEAFTAIADGRPVAMLGVSSTSLMNAKGSPWMLGTDAVFDHGRALLTLGPQVFDRWMETFETLENIISVDNDRAIRLLKRWGFEVSDGPVVTHGGVSFVPFRLGR